MELLYSRKAIFSYYKLYCCNLPRKFFLRKTFYTRIYCIEKCIFLSWNIQKIGRTFLTSLFHHAEGEIFKDSVVTILIGGCQCGFCYRFTSHTKELALGMMSLQCHHYVSQTFAVGELSKHHCKQLVPTREALHVLVAIILADKTVEVVPIQMPHQLRENIFALILCSLLI